MTLQHVEIFSLLYKIFTYFHIQGLTRIYFANNRARHQHQQGLFVFFLLVYSVVLLQLLFFRDHPWFITYYYYCRCCCHCSYILLMMSLPIYALSLLLGFEYCFFCRFSHLGEGIFSNVFKLKTA